MMASACSKTAFATSVTSARVGSGFSIIDSSIWVATMTGLPIRRQRFTIRRWMIGSSSIGHSIPRSPRAIEDDVGRADHLVEIAHRARAFDLGHDRGGASAFAQKPAELIEVLLFPGETQGDEIDLQLDPEGDVGQVLFRQGGEIHVHAGEIDVPARAERAGGEDGGANAVVLFFLHPHLHEAVVEENDVADRDVVDQAVVIDRDRVRLGRARAADRDLERVADRELEILCQHPGANGRALGVEEECRRCGRACSAIARTRGTMSRTHSCLAWLMLSRKVSVPARIIFSMTSELSEAGPRVQMIRVLRIALRIQPRLAIARRFLRAAA